MKIFKVMQKVCVCTQKKWSNNWQTCWYWKWYETFLSNTKDLSVNALIISVHRWTRYNIKGRLIEVYTHIGTSIKSSCYFFSFSGRIRKLGLACKKRLSSNISAYFANFLKVYIRNSCFLAKHLHIRTCCVDNRMCMRILRL